MRAKKGEELESQGRRKRSELTRPHHAPRARTFLGATNFSPPPLIKCSSLVFERLSSHFPLIFSRIFFSHHLTFTLFLRKSLSSQEESLFHSLWESLSLRKKKVSFVKSFLWLLSSAPQFFRCQFRPTEEEVVLTLPASSSLSPHWEFLTFFFLSPSWWIKMMKNLF